MSTLTLQLEVVDVLLTARRTTRPLRSTMSETGYWHA